MIERVSQDIILVGTAHVSKKSAEEVKAALGQFEPDIVGVELDRSRYEALRDRAKWQKTPVTEIVRSGRSFFFLAQLILSSFQRKLADRYGVEPGVEMVEAVNGAANRGLKLVLLDRDIGVTLKRAWRLMRLREKLAFGWEAYKIFLGFAHMEDVAEAQAAKEGEDEAARQEELDRLMDEDVLSQMMEEIGRFAPSVKRVLIDERDLYIAKKIQLASKRGRVVAVVGAGHVKGIRAALEGGLKGAPTFDELNEVPQKKVPWGQAAAWSIPLLIFWIIIYQALQGHLERAGEALAWWWIIHGVAAGGFAALARAHPYSIATGAAVAGFTAIHPTLAAGWFAGLVEAKVRTPTVADFERLQAWRTFRDLTGNSVFRVILVTALTNVGSSIGTWLALPLLAKGLS